MIKAALAAATTLPDVALAAALRPASHATLAANARLPRNVICLAIRAQPPPGLVSMKTVPTADPR